MTASCGHPAVKTYQMDLCGSCVKDAHDRLRPFIDRTRATTPRQAELNAKANRSFMLALANDEMLIGRRFDASA